jgi:pyruvate carboxylase subunit B
MKYTVEIATRSVIVEVDEDAIRVDGRPVAARLDGVPGSAIRRLVQGQGSREFVAVPGEERGQWRLTTDGQRIDAAVLDDRSLAVRAAARKAGGTKGAGVLKAPMPGLVVRLLVAEGEAVTAGKGLVVVEAMKMENELKAVGPGTVKKIHVAPGDRVEKGAPLVELA